MSGYLRALVRGGAALAVAASAAGCALPNPFTGGDVLLGYAASAPETGALRRVVVGVDVRATGPWGGVELGASDLLVAPQRDVATDQAPASLGPQLPPPLCFTWTDDAGATHAVGIVAWPAPPDRPAFVRHRAFGAGCVLAATSQGAHLGYSSVTHVAVPRDDDALYAITLDAQDWRATRFVRSRGGDRP